MNTLRPHRIAEILWFALLTAVAGGLGCGNTTVNGADSAVGSGGNTGSGGSITSGSGGKTGSGGTSVGSGGSAGGSGGKTGSGGASVGSGGSASGSGGKTGSGGASGSGGGCSGAATYDQLVLCDTPVAFWDMSRSAGTETDLTGHGHTGTYKGGIPASATMPNGDQAADMDGATQLLTVPSHASFSIPTTGDLTWEGWIRPDVLEFPSSTGSGYVDWMGKCDQYSPTCEWEARMYKTTTTESPNRPNRISAYVFNPSAGLGSAADWQPATGLIQAGQWYHVVGEYTTKSQPSNCTNVAAYPGSIEIWVNGVQWNHSYHGQTGCMSQYSVVPKANGSAVEIGSMALDSFFKGAIGNVAIYDHLLTPAQIAAHYTRMTGKTPTGSCANTCSF